MELEDAFPHQETGDQVTAIEEVKADLLRPKPMDRLICGDVGFGKTEIAVRAAFKAVMEGKQVAVLVPTTLLAEQHFITFSERYAPFPVKVAMLSRFVSRAEQERIVEDVGKGAADVVIGTHRLLSRDVRFKDLGLVVVDEEQRFGVAHKARIVVAHGQMDEDQLERQMVRFWDRDADILVSTVIIESGLDVPNANTLIVDTAHLLGLAQMYQLRGRVGRSSERAFAYFFFPPQRELTEEAHERLTTISRHQALGSASG